MKRSERCLLELCKFLKRNNALEKFCVNKADFNPSLKDIIKSDEPIINRVIKILEYSNGPYDHSPKNEKYDWFSYMLSTDTAFVWEDTMEGLEFWSNLCCLWERIISDLIRREKHGV